MSDTSEPMPDPLSLMRDAYAQGVEAWSSAMEELVGSEEFAANSARLLALYAGQQEAIRTASRLAAESIHIPTIDDIERVATLVVNLERKVDEMVEAGGALDRRATEIETSIASAAKLIGGLQERVEKLAESVDSAMAKATQPASSGAAKAAESKPAPKKTSTAKASGSSADSGGGSSAGAKKSSATRSSAAPKSGARRSGSTRGEA